MSIKYVSKRLLQITLIFLVSSCTNTDLDLLENPNAVSPDQASVNDLYNQIQINFSQIFFALESIPGAAARMYHAGGNFTYQNWTGPTNFNGLWFSAYSGLFPDIDALEKLSIERGLDVHLASIKILKAYTLMGLVDLLGDVPYTEAGQGTNIISPAPTPGAQIYASADDLLTEAISLLQTTSAAPPKNDFFYDGDPMKWIRLANSLKLRSAVTRRLIDPTAAKFVIDELIASDLLIDDASFDFQTEFSAKRSNPDSRHPFYGSGIGHYETVDGAYLSNYYMWLLKGEKLDQDGSEFEDPRTRYYFYRKVDNSLTQDPTTYSCHLNLAPLTANKPSYYTEVDPRLPFCMAHLEGYSGRDHLNGTGIPPDGPVRTSYGLYPGGGQFDDDSFSDTRQGGTTGGGGAGIYPIMLSSFTQFLRAEAALMLGTSDDPKTFLERGIRASMAKVESFENLVAGTMSELREIRGGSTATVKEIFGISPEKVDAYVDLVLNQFDHATSDDERLDIIMKEYYIALWGNGYEAYNMYRRTGKPDNMAPALEQAPGEFSRSFFLPDVHVNRNAKVTQKEITDRVFWDDGSIDLY